ncbi:hypothetical protein HOG17_04125 [Candidatus Peregrinibacteria bacterium]|jgi:hypothetical protein|nr:hypothetical protein [Candidatus Peregrinibacteria bacterium]MBT4148000.1 hypothetical protein [Candidatus Peregrinibacteria bacterium]MBT4366447.1 hypothetical protein [Candidatus Peregrinibacteria bacterium]MBT4456596.1 hypothetical protein [Candidatus Peregrinibacteria bacterium]
MKKLLSFALISTLLFSGCGLSNKAEETPQVPDEELSADSLLDEDLYTSAIETKDIEKCGKILNEAKKVECTDLINAILLTDKATNENDDDYCDDIKLDRYKENCMDEVAEVEKAEGFEDFLVDQDTISHSLIENDDLEGCESLEVEAEKLECNHNILVDRAMAQNDTNYCEKLGDQESIDSCIESVAIANTISEEIPEEE